MKIGIVEHKDFSVRAIDQLQSLGEVSFFDLQCESLAAFISNKEILFVRLGYFIDEKVLCEAKSLKYICTPTTGLNHIDLDYVKRRNIQVISLKGETAFLTQITATSEHTIGLVISLLRYYQRVFRCEENKDFNREVVKGHEINSSKVGIVGLGRIGTHLVDYLNVFGAIVNFYDSDIVKKNPLAIKFNSIEALIEASDIIILSASYSKKNEKMITSGMLDLMFKKYFINTSRGELVEENYLLDRVEEGHFAGVAIDVFHAEQETSNNNKRIIELARKDLNFLYTPHMGGATMTSMIKTELFTVQKLSRFLDKGSLI